MSDFQVIKSKDLDSCYIIDYIYVVCLYKEVLLLRVQFV